jgi:hypothetical protein
MRNPHLVSALATAAINAALLVLILLPSRSEPRLAASVLTVFDVAAVSTAPEPEPPEAPQPEPVEPTPPQPVVVPPPEVPLPVPNEIAVAVRDETTNAANGGACDLTAPVQAALQSSAAVRLSLPRIPAERRSVANAIMVWKVAWLAEDEQLDAAAIAAIQGIVAQTVAAATAECRLEPQVGPRLLLLAGTGDTIVLAVGSGQWRWQDLLDTARPGSTDDNGLAPIPSATILASLDRASSARR